MPFFTYILRCADGTFYTGSTSDLKKRLHSHNNLKSGAHYTKIRRPVQLVHSEEFSTFRAARVREWRLKKLSRKEKEALITNLALTSSMAT